MASCPIFKKFNDNTVIKLILFIFNKGIYSTYFIDYYALLSNRTSNNFKSNDVMRVLTFFKYLHYQEKMSEKLLQQVAIKKLNSHHNYGTILTNIIIIIIDLSHLLILGILHNNIIDRINLTSTEHWRVIIKLWHRHCFLLMSINKAKCSTHYNTKQ